MQFYHVLEPALAENLDEDAYLLANPDVGAASMSARDHFVRYGRHEGRQQLARDYLRNLQSYRTEKFNRFRDALDLDEDVLTEGTFPIVAGNHHFALSEYVQEFGQPWLRSVQSIIGIRSARPLHGHWLRLPKRRLFELPLP